MSDSTKFRNAITNSARLAEQDDYGRALEVVDEAIAEAVQLGENSWVKTLCHHGAVIARHIENLELAKRYYEQSLASNQENSRALYGLASVAREQGDLKAAKQYAVRCYQALTQNDEDVLREHWLDLLLKNWPEVAGK